MSLTEIAGLLAIVGWLALVMAGLVILALRQPKGKRRIRPRQNPADWQKKGPPSQKD